jgi:transposase
VVETGRRRRWTEDEKLRIVAESLSGSRLVSSTARRYGISRSLLTTWRQQFRVEPSPDGEAGTEFVPAVVLPEGPASPRAVSSSTRMEIVVSCDRRIIVDAGVDVAALARVLDLLSRR